MTQTSTYSFVTFRTQNCRCPWFLVRDRFESLLIWWKVVNIVTYPCTNYYSEHYKILSNSGLLMLRKFCTFQLFPYGVLQFKWQQKEGGGSRFGAQQKSFECLLLIWFGAQLHALWMRIRRRRRRRRRQILCAL